jgi:hypothetical protein
MQNEANSLQWKIRNFAYLSKPVKKQYAKESRDLRIQAKRRFCEAGELFAQCKLYNFAGSCYFTANSHHKAAGMFKQLK